MGPQEPPHPGATHREPLDLDELLGEMRVVEAGVAVLREGEPLGHEGVGRPVRRQAPTPGVPDAQAALGGHSVPQAQDLSARQPESLGGLAHGDGPLKTEPNHVEPRLLSCAQRDPLVHTPEHAPGGDRIAEPLRGDI